MDFMTGMLLGGIVFVAYSLLRTKVRSTARCKEYRERGILAIIQAEVKKDDATYCRANTERTDIK